MYKDGRTSPLGIKTVAAVELHLWQVNTQGLIMNFLYKTGEKKHETLNLLQMHTLYRYFKEIFPFPDLMTLIASKIYHLRKMKLIRTSVRGSKLFLILIFS